MSSTSLYETTPQTGTVSTTNLTSLYSNTTNFTSGVVNSSVYSVNGGTGVTVDPTTGNVLVSIGQSVATTANPTFAGATLGNVTVGIANNNTVTTTSGALILESATGEIDTGNSTILSTNSSSFLLLNFPTTVTAFNSATSLQLGANGGLTNINGTLEVDQGIITNNITIGVADDNTITTISGDLNLTATAPGNVNITSETNEPTRITRNSGSTNIAVRSLALSVQSAGTPAAGFGNSLEYEIETAVGNTERAGYVAVISTDVTPASEDFSMSFGLMTAGATADTKMTLNNAGDLTLDGGIRVLGSTSGSSIFKAPATGSTLSYVLPGTAGAASTVLTNDGSGNLTWALPGGGGSTFGNITVAVVNDNTISTTTGDLELTATGNNGVNITSGSDAPTLITRNSAVTNTSIRGLALSAQTSLTPAAGFGGSLEYQVEAQVGNTERAGYISVNATDVTAGSEDFSMYFGLMENGAAYTSKMILDSTGSLALDNDLTVGGNAVNLAQDTVFAYSENNDRLNRPYVQSTTGNTSGWRIRAPNATTSAAASLSVSNTNDASNTKFLSIQATGSTTEPFRIASGQYIANVLSASGDSISIRDGVTQYATINPAGPTVGTDLTTKTYVDGLIPDVPTYDTNVVSVTGGAELDLRSYDGFSYAIVGSTQFIGGTNVTITESSPNVITIAAPDLNTTYDFNATSTTGGANLNLVGSDSTTDTVKLTNGGHITATYASGTAITLGSDATDANTVSTIVARDSSGNFSAGTISMTKGLVGSTANFTDWPNAQFVASQANGGDGHTYNMGIVGEAVASASDSTVWGVGVYGNGFTNSGTRSAGVLGDGSVTNTADTGSAVGVRGYATDTHAGGFNIGVLADASASATGNYAFYAASGDYAAAGAVQFVTLGSNGNITLAPNGTGNVVNTFSNGGNLTNNRNYVFGAIRNATTAAAGDVWNFNATGSVGPLRGISLDNSADTTKNPGEIIRGYSGSAASGQRGRLVFEKARNTAASPTANQAADVLCSIEATGYSSTGWVNDTIAAAPGNMVFAAGEPWISNTNLGTVFAMNLAPTATTISTTANLVQVLNVSPQTFASRSDAFTWANGKTGTTQTMSLDVSGNLIVTGDVRINGNDIQGSGGTNAISLTSANTTTTVRGDIINLANGANTATNLQLGSTFANFASAGTQYAAMNSTSTTFTNTGNNTFIRQGTVNTVQPALTLRYQRSDTANPNDGDGVDFRLGVGGTSTNTNIARFDAVYKTSGFHQFGISVSNDSFSADTDTIYRGQADKTVIRATPTGTTGTASDILTVESTNITAAAPIKLNGSTSGSVTLSAGATPAAQTYTLPAAYPGSSGLFLTSTTGGVTSWATPAATFSYGSFYNGSTITPAAANTAYVFPIGSNNILGPNVTQSNTSEIHIDAVGTFNIQFTIQMNNADNAAEHTAYFWLRKNGVDVANSATDFSVIKNNGKNVAALLFSVASDGNDYFEIAYAVSDTNVTFPSFASQASPFVRPAIPALILNVLQIGT